MTTYLRCCCCCVIAPFASGAAALPHRHIIGRCAAEMTLSRVCASGWCGLAEPRRTSSRRPLALPTAAKSRHLYDDLPTEMLTAAATDDCYDANAAINSLPPPHCSHSHVRITPAESMAIMLSGCVSRLYDWTSARWLWADHGRLYNNGRTRCSIISRGRWLTGLLFANKADSVHMSDKGLSTIKTRICCISWPGIVKL